jgi:Outer membrane protein beta-barrel domain
MKKMYILITLCAIALTGYAQQKKDSTVKNTTPDTIRIGGILIIRKAKKNNNDSTVTLEQTGVSITKSKRRSNINYIIIDAGFANWSDQTTYPTTGNYVGDRPLTPAFGRQDMKLREGKSTNINFWLFMQKVPLYKANINLKFGLGVEWFNYALRSPVSFRESGVFLSSLGLGLITKFTEPFVYRDSISFSKNKLNLKYITVPLMLNFSTTKQKGKTTLSTSFGVSASYLIRERNKQHSNERGRDKNQGNYDIQKFKLSYIGELGLGKLRLYGSYSPKSIFERSLDIRPFAMGIRFSNW